jgi:hypothetical protein
MVNCAGKITAVSSYIWQTYRQEVEARSKCYSSTSYISCFNLLPVCSLAVYWTISNNFLTLHLINDKHIARKLKPGQNAIVLLHIYLVSICFLSVLWLYTAWTISNNFLTLHLINDKHVARKLKPGQNAIVLLHI